MLTAQAQLARPPFFKLSLSGGRWKSRRRAHRCMGRTSAPSRARRIGSGLICIDSGHASRRACRPQCDTRYLRPRTPCSGVMQAKILPSNQPVQQRWSEVSKTSGIWSIGTMRANHQSQVVAEPLSLEFKSASVLPSRASSGAQRDAKPTRLPRRKPFTSLT